MEIQTRFNVDFKENNVHLSNSLFLLLRVPLIPNIVYNKFMIEKPKILFLCTGNSCRSQMAEGFASHFYSDKFFIRSAGLEAYGLNPDAVYVMEEIGIDIGSQLSERINDLDEKKFDFVITVCGNADKNCPVFPAGTAIIHRGFDDPPELAQKEKTIEAKLRHYRRVRDEIKEFILTLPELLANYND